MDIVISAVSQRTGSTLLQRIFNRRKETLIWGEHGGVLNHFLKIYESCMYFSSKKENRKRYFSNGEDPNQNIANLCPECKYAKEATMESIRKFFSSYYSQYREGHDTIGFKEVRYGKELQLLKKCYPNIKILLLVRNPVDIWKSIPKDINGKRRSSKCKYKRFWWISFSELINQWNNFTNLYMNYEKEYSNTYLIKYEDIIKKEESTMKLIANLAKLDISQINEVLSVKIYSTKDKIPRKEEIIITNKCKENMKKLGYL